MTEPNTPLGGLVVPNTGDLVGAWGTAALNPNFVAIDGTARGVQTLSFSGATTITLTAPTGSITPGAGPTQSQNAVLKLTGTLSGASLVTLPLPGFYIIDNRCTVGNFYVQMRAVGTGNLIAAPPGEACHIYCDGTDVTFVDMGHVGSYLNLAVGTTPGWVNACTVIPYLLCNGAVYSTSIATALAGQLGSTYGGNGITTFAVPDLRNKYFLALGTTITTATGGINGAQLGATGGVQSLTIGTSNIPANIPYTDPGHVHTPTGGGVFLKGGGSGASAQAGAPGADAATTSNATVGITINPGSPNTPMQVLPPSIVAGITLIKT